MIRPFRKFSARTLRALVPIGLAGAWLAGSICPMPAQEARESLAGEQSAEAAKKHELLQGYNLHYGPVSFQVESSLRAEFTDNVFNSSVNRRTDEILKPEVDLRSYWPITELNALTFSLGLNYQYFVNNTQLNADTPLISPGSELALVLYVKNFRFRFHERFSYEESLFYWGAYSQETGQYINLNDIGTFGRINNLAGLTADWDLDAIVLSLGYDHENFISTLSSLDYLTRASDLLSLEGDVILGPKFRSGAEGKASWNVYDTKQLPDHWRARVGPFVDISPSDYVSLRTGGGHETARIPRIAGLATFSTPYYAYARITHTVNDWLNYSVCVTHENQLGWNTANVETTRVGFDTSLRFIDRVELNPGFSYGWAKESGPAHTGSFYREQYGYFQASLGLIYHFGERWAAELRYGYFRKNSDVALLEYDRNSITAGVTYRF